MSAFSNVNDGASRHLQGPDVCLFLEPITNDRHDLVESNAGSQEILKPSINPVIVAFEQLIERLKCAGYVKIYPFPPSTTNPAKMVRIDDYVGSLTVGRMADFIVIRTDPSMPAQAVLKATPADIALVVIAGAPIYGDDEVMKQLLPSVKLEPLSVCGSKKLLNLAGTYAADNQD